ncbi:hypothetical protein PFISCL1PPCAC_8631, partial [Pristionchus fissidentatus]
RLTLSRYRVPSLTHSVMSAMLRLVALFVALLAVVLSYPTSADTYNFRQALNGELLGYGASPELLTPRGARGADPFNIEDFRWRVRTMG